VRFLRKKLLRFLALYLVPPLGWLIISFLFLFSKKKIIQEQELPDSPVIVALWHGELLMVAPFYKSYRKKPHAKLIISEHFDGDLIARTLAIFGLGSIRGSSTRGGIKALLNGIKELKNGYDIGITPDGPRGPRHQVADGVVVMAQKAKIPVVCLRVGASEYWELKSWDKFMIPKPFSTLTYKLSKPLDLTKLSVEEAKELLSKELSKNAV